MACRYYDDIIVEKIKRWVPEASNLRVLKPDESRRLFELAANDSNDSEFKLPIIALSRNNDIELLSTIKSPKTYDGLKLLQTDKQTAQLNVIPIKLIYSLDIYTKTMDEGDELVRNFIFKLINNPLLKITIPYNGFQIEHTANLRLLSSISDTSDISEHLFPGQFTRWTIQLELQDGFLFSIPYRNNWKLVMEEDLEFDSTLELSEDISTDGEKENLDFKFKKM